MIAALTKPQWVGVLLLVAGVTLLWPNDQASRSLDRWIELDYLHSNLTDLADEKFESRQWRFGRYAIGLLLIAAGTMLLLRVI